MTNREKFYVQNSWFGNAVQAVWDRNTENAQYPDRMSLAQAKAVVNNYMLELGFDSSLLRK